MIRFFFILIIPSILLASSGLATAGSDPVQNYDIVPRVINFLLFAGILYYLLANAIKDMYKGRINKISNELEGVQAKLLESKNKKLELMQKIDEAKIEASNIISLSKEEAKLMVKKIEEQIQHELHNLELTQEHKKNFEVKQLKKELAARILKQVFADRSYDLSHQHVLDLVFKKVS